MTRRTFFSSFSSCALSFAQPAERPNVLLIVTDDEGWFDLGANGNPYAETPILDRMAREGVRLTHFYCSPVCTPTRAALMTGRHYQRTGAVDTYLGRDTLDAREVTLGQMFQRAGYRTACIGKWHLGRYMKYHPNERGFDEFFGFWQYGFINRYDDSDELFENKTPVETTGYITDVLTNRALLFLEENRQRPFFLYLAYNAPHAPYLAPDAYIERFLNNGLPLQEARIYGMNACLDANIGRLLHALEIHGLSGKTIILFMSDNGGVSRFFKAGLRGNKGSVYEGGIRSPFIARWPERFPAGAVVSSMAQHIDVLPTLADLADIGPPVENPLDGRSFARLLRDGRGESAHEFLFSQWNRGYPVLESVPGHAELRANWAVRDRQGLKFHSNGELYDLAADPSEKNNLAARRADDAARLRREFEKFFADVWGSRRHSRVPIEVGRPDENPVEIDLTWAHPVGQKIKPTYRHYNRDTIENWTDPSEYLRWDVDVVASGVYDIELSYGCRPGAQGSRVRFHARSQAVDYTVQPTGGRDVFARFSAGRMALERGRQWLELRAVHIAHQEPFLLHKLWLRRL
jgi:arylsulfatase A